MKKEVFNIGNNENEKLEIGSLKIGKNVMIYDESFVVLKNIARVSLGQEPPKTYSKWLFILPIISFFALFSKQTSLILAGIAIIAICAAIIFLIYSYNSMLAEYIMVHLNSGKTLLLKSSGHDFSLQVVDTIINCINTGEGCNINFKDCTIHNLQNGEVNILKG